MKLFFRWIHRGQSVPPSDFETGDDHSACPDELGEESNKIRYTGGLQNPVKQTEKVCYIKHVWPVVKINRITLSLISLEDHK